MSVGTTMMRRVVFTILWNGFAKAGTPHLPVAMQSETEREKGREREVKEQQSNNRRENKFGGREPKRAGMQKDFGSGDQFFFLNEKKKLKLNKN
jgi:hypothetical protein